jgi:protein-L-isoaspartate O-methyltransferase
VLDVGCGTGEGLAALLAISTRSIVAIEENFDCIETAERSLIDLGYSVKTIPRLGYIEHPDGRHELELVKGEAIEEGPSVTLV